MSLRAAFQEVAVAITDAFDDVPRPLVYLWRQTITVDDPLDETAPTPTEVPTKGFKVDFRTRERDGVNVLDRDTLIRIPSLQLARDVEAVSPGASFSPSNEDAVRLTDTGEEFEVVWVTTDPAEAMWNLQVRAPG